MQSDSQQNASHVPLHCTREQYEEIYDTCKSRFLKHNCSEFEFNGGGAARGDGVVGKPKIMEDFDYFYDGEGQTDSSGRVSVNRMDKLLMKSETYKKNEAAGKSDKFFAFWWLLLLTKSLIKLNLFI